MFSLFQEKQAPLSNRPSISETKVAKLMAKQATIDFYANKIKWLEAGQHPTQLLILACRDVPTAELGGRSAQDRKTFVRNALRYYKKKIQELK